MLHGERAHVALAARLQAVEFEAVDAVVLGREEGLKVLEQPVLQRRHQVRKCAELTHATGLALRFRIH